MSSVRLPEQSSETGSGQITPSAVKDGSRLLFWIYSLAIFLSAFLLFQIQPLIGKFLLPWFGGTPGVWSACLLFFQVLLFGGYAYAHLTTSWLSPRVQAVLHALLLLVACVALPIIPSEARKPSGDGDPVWQIVMVLAATVGLPFFVLSATGPLLQGWFSRTHEGRSPYRLYALSNAGSLLALISYPTVFDWAFPAGTLARLWSWSFATFAVLCAICAAGMAARSRTAAGNVEPLAAAEAVVFPSLGKKVLWFFLAMIPSVLLLATTNQVCLDVASVPFLWVLPLTLYLLSFILCFDGERWYSRSLMMPAAAVALVCVYLVLRAGATVPFALQLLAYFMVLFLGAMVCHGELVRQKPHVKYLTTFYLLISAGGAAGGVFVGIVSPLVFQGYYELHLGLYACAVLMLIVLFTDRSGRLYQGRPIAVWIPLMAALGVFGIALVDEAKSGREEIIDVKRNFYGVLRVMETYVDYDQEPLPALRLLNGRIEHGFEYTSSALWEVPTSYYSPQSGIGLALNQRTDGRPRRIGLVGLGTGTSAAYARPGDHFRFYEINLEDERLARKHFHYLSDCLGEVEVIHGDARLTLEREQPQDFDVLALDAFSGDAIPVHLLTKEAFAIYLRHVKPDGIIAVHISNKHFALEPVVEAIADAHNLARVTIDAHKTPFGGYANTWILVSRDPQRLESSAIQDAASPGDDRRVLWTDDRASLFEVLWLRSFDSLWSATKETFTDFRSRIFGGKKVEEDSEDDDPDNDEPPE